MYTRSFVLAALAAIATVTGCEKAADHTSAPSPADNTGRNKTDSSTTKTPIDQSQSAGDVKVTAEIRRAIMDDKTMSMNAQNCKIITDKSGVVTLRGVVNSQAEKDAIQAKAQAVAGVTRIDNQLEVKTN